MDSKPMVTYAGDTGLFSSLQSHLLQGLPQEPLEWRRSYGRAPKTVYVETNFIPFSEEVLPKEGDRQLIGQPVFHTYWTDCTDVDQYRSIGRDGIQMWLNILKEQNITGWMVVLVETLDSRKGNKLLPRTTVLDKIKRDFGGKQTERCVSLIDPFKSDSRAAESWQALLFRFRQLLLAAYNRTLGKFEEGMRSQREKRNKTGWSFCEYFLLQEELAFVYEMLGLYDEALVQYDELDALFTQFVLNSKVGDTPEWLHTFQCPFEDWSGLSLSPVIDQSKRDYIRDCSASLINLRNYLFSRQCAMLLLMCKPWEVAQRSLPFLHNCMNELQILEISCPPGAVACWVFLSCLEVLHMCEKFKDSNQVEAYSVYTVNLWAYARDKLHELGDLCGLMPGVSSSSEQLHTVVELSAGMRQEIAQEASSQPSPIDKLKEALSSKEAFKKHYLELSELAMGTYKHIGRIRSARLMGRDLANFYLRLGEPQKAITFLTDALKTFKDENWVNLVVQTQLKLTHCYRSVNDIERYIKTCAQIASSSVLEDDIRNSHFDEMMSSLKEIDPETSVLIPTDDIFTINTVEVMCDSEVIISDVELRLKLEVTSHLPQPVLFEKILISLCHSKESDSGNKAASPKPWDKCHEPIEKKLSTGRKPVQRTTSAAMGSGGLEVCAEPVGEDPDPVNLATFRLDIVEHLDYKQDKSLGSASLVCRNSNRILRRKDSQGSFLSEAPVVKEDFSSCVFVDNIKISPGKNTIFLETKAGIMGTYTLGQISFQMERLEYLLRKPMPGVSFKVVSEPPTIILNKGESDLLAGVEQQMMLSVSTGSTSLAESASLRICCSRGLQMQVLSTEDRLSHEFDVSLSMAGPFQTLSIPLRVLADLPAQKDANTIEHKVCITCPWISQQNDILLHFLPPFMSSHRLHTAHTRKFVQVLVHGLSSQQFQLAQHTLMIQGSHDDMSLKPLNPLTQTLIICTDQNASYMWELNVGSTQETTPIKTEFTVQFCSMEEAAESKIWRSYKCSFDLHDYKTLFTVRSKVEPSKGSEFCRAGNMCHMNIQILQVNPSSHTSLMYEVLADQTMWAVCGRTAGVVSLDSSEKQTVTLDVMPLIGGFLPLPSVRLSKYIPADQRGGTRDAVRKPELGTSSCLPRLEPFSPGQVYNWSRALQVHVLPASNTPSVDLSLS